MLLNIQGLVLGDWPGELGGQRYPDWFPSSKTQCSENGEVELGLRQATAPRRGVAETSCLLQKHQHQRELSAPLYTQVQLFGCH